MDGRGVGPARPAPVGGGADVSAGRVPTREEAITAAAEIYLEAKIRIETERLVAAAQEGDLAAAATADGVEDQTHKKE